MPTYIELLKDPRWQRKRLEILQRDGFSCTNCGDTETELHVDHKFYEYGKMPWEYPDDSLQTLCKPCHRKAGLKRKALKEVLKADRDIEQIIGYAKALGALDDGGTIDFSTYEEAKGIADAIGAGLIAEDIFEYCGEATAVSPSALEAAIASGAWRQGSDNAAAVIRRRAARVRLSTTRRGRALDTESEE